MIDKNKLITELDKLDCISNINYYTNNCNSHDDIVNTIEELSDEGFKVLFVDDNKTFEFEETHDIDYSFINEEVKENVE